MWNTRISIIIRLKAAATACKSIKTNGEKARPIAITACQSKTAFIGGGAMIQNCWLLESGIQLLEACRSINIKMRKGRGLIMVSRVHQNCAFWDEVMIANWKWWKQCTNQLKIRKSAGPCGIVFFFNQNCLVEKGRLSIESGRNSIQVNYRATTKIWAEDNNLKLVSDQGYSSRGHG